MQLKTMETRGAAEGGPRLGDCGFEILFGARLDVAISVIIGTSPLL